MERSLERRGEADAPYYRFYRINKVITEHSIHNIEYNNNGSKLTLKIAGLFLLSGILLLLPPAYAKTFDSYEGLRSYQGRPGEIIRLNSGKAAGEFQFVSSSSGNGIEGKDDGGIIIRAPGGWWARVFAYSAAQPVELDWFEPENKDDISSLLIRLAKRYAPDLYIRTPSTAMTLILDFTDLSKYDIRDFYFLESDKPVVIQQKSLPADPDKLLTITDYRKIRIGGDKLNLTFSGLHKGIRGGHNAKADGDAGNGLISFKQIKAKGELLEFSANIENSRMYGIDHRGAHTGSAGRTQRVEIAGNFLNSGLRLNSGIKDLTLENPLVTDPYAVQFGWNGKESFLNNGYNAIPFYWERSRSLSVTYVDRLSGSVRLEYGGASWFMSQVDYIGNGPDDPFVIRYKDLGYSASGIKVETRGFLDTAGKTDYVGGGKKRQYLKVIEQAHEYGFGLRNSVLFEATSEDGAGGLIYFNEGIHLEMENISGNVNTAILDHAGDYSRNHVIRGTMTIPKTDNDKQQRRQKQQLPVLTIFDGDLIEDFTGYHISLDYKNKLDRAAHGNLIRNCRILDGGYITVPAGSQDNRIEKTVFEGAPRRVIHIANARNPNLPVSLELESITAPAGSTIEADVNKNVAVTLDKVRLDLPYQF